MINKIDNDRGLYLETPGCYLKDSYRELGVQIIRNYIPEEIVNKWIKSWNEFYNGLSEREVHKPNPVELKEELPHDLATIYQHPILIHLMKSIHGMDVALFNHRIVLKDKLSSNKVFLHQDSCYHAGYLDKCSFFIPLTKVNEKNGGLSFYLRSHKLGYLGDAGEINPSSFDFNFQKITPELYPGDVVIMNSHTWHESGPNTTNENRVLIDIISQWAGDPTGKELLAGEWQTDFRFSAKDPTSHFKSSRILKIKNFEKNENK